MGKTGLFFGSFNPIHIGHMAIANYMVEFTDLKEIWFVVSPQNPHKSKTSLLNHYQRLEMVHLAIDNDFRFKASDIEFYMPQPSYTIDTLTYLSEKFPQREFALIMGSDNLVNFEKWKNSETIAKKYTRYVYPRPGTENIISEHINTVRVDAPVMEISSSFIREAIADKKVVNHFLPSKVYAYIDKMGYYL